MDNATDIATQFVWIQLLLPACSYSAESVTFISINIADRHTDSVYISRAGVLYGVYVYVRRSRGSTSK